MCYFRDNDIQNNKDVPGACRYGLLLHTQSGSRLTHITSTETERSISKAANARRD